MRRHFMDLILRHRAAFWQFVLRLIGLLTTPRGSFVTGTTIQVDGGSHSSLL